MYAKSKEISILYHKMINSIYNDKRLSKLEKTFCLGREDGQAYSLYKVKGIISKQQYDRISNHIYKMMRKLTEVSK